MTVQTRNGEFKDLLIKDLSMLRKETSESKQLFRKDNFNSFDVNVSTQRVYGYKPLVWKFIKTN